MFFSGVFVVSVTSDDFSWEFVIFFVMALAIAFFVTWHGLLNDVEQCTKYIKVGISFDASLKRLADESFVSKYTSTDESTIWWDKANDSFVQVAVACASENESGEEVEMLSAVDSMRTDNMFAGNHPTQLPSAETAANNPKQDGNECQCHPKHNASHHHIHKQSEVLSLRSTRKEIDLIHSRHIKFEILGMQNNNRAISRGSQAAETK